MGYILLVDYHQDLLGDFLAEVFADYHQVVTARSLAEAVDLLSRSHFDLIITEALNQETPLHFFDPAFLDDLKHVAGSTPIVLSSVYPCTSRQGAKQLGFADVLPKPFTVDQLEEMVGRVMVKDTPAPLVRELPAQAEGGA